ncbi:hypothetical protein L0F63_003503 [Massospora cicadina]|nr:hypothetical protein L0F63_003503 [Massospora cicadina]
MFIWLLLSLHAVYAARTCSTHVCIDIEPKGANFEFVMSGPSNTSYMAVGIGTTMANSDMYLGWFKKQQAYVSWRRSKGHSLQPELNPAPNLIASDFKNMTITFQIPQSSVKLSTTDANDMIWAFSNDESQADGKLGRHTDRGSLRYSFQGPVAQGPSPAILWHGALMLIAWLILPALAIFTARFLKNRLGPRWLTLHQSAFFSAALLAVISIILVAVKNGNVLDNPHAALGLLVMILFGIQIAIGVVIDKLWSPGRRSVPWQDKVHWWVGRSLFLLAIANIFYGIIILGNPSYFWVPTLFILFAILATFIFAEVKMGKITH